MPTVPYNPVPSITPQGIPTPYRTDAGATPAAFGAGVGEAKERFGAQLEKAGDVLAAATLQRQDLQNQAATDKADAQFMTEAGAEHQKFSAMQGGDRAAYFPTYIKNLQAIRERIRDGLPNAMVQKRYDTQTLSTLGRTIFNGAGAAGSGAAEDAVRSAGLRTNAIQDQGGLAENPAQADDLAKQAYKAGVQAERLRGTTDPAALDEAGKTAAGGVYHNYTTQLADKDPYKAQEELDKHVGAMTEQQRTSAQHAVRSMRESVESTNVATSILDANRSKEDNSIQVSQRELEQQAVAQAKQLHPNDPEFAIRLKNQVSIQFRKEQAENKADTANNLRTIHSLILAGAESRQEIMANPQGKQAVLGMPKDVDVDAKINQYIKARDLDFNKNQLVQLKWQQQHDPEGFLLIDPFDPKLKLSDDNIRAVIGWQAQTAKTPGQRDSRPWHALSILQANNGQALTDAGVSKTKDPETFNSYMANLSDALQSWRDTHGGKPPTDKDIVDTIGPELMKKVKYPGWFGTYEEERFKRPMAEPPKEYKEPLANQGFTDEQIQRQWNRERLKKAFESKVSAGSQDFKDRFQGK